MGITSEPTSIINEIGWIDFYLFVSHASIDTFQGPVFFLAATVGKISYCPTARPFTGTICGMPISTNYHMLLKCIIKACKIRFLQIIFFEIMYLRKNHWHRPQQKQQPFDSRQILATPKTPSRERLPSKSREPQGMVLGQPGGAAIDFQPTPPINQEPLGCVSIFPFC